MTHFYPLGTDPATPEINTADVCAAAWATYKQPLHEVIDLDLVRLSMETHDYLVTLLDEAAMCRGTDAVG